MNAPSNLKYTKSDEWFDPNTGAMGLSDYAQSQLSDIVFVEILVDEGDTIEANKDLSNKPETLNSDPYGQAWMVKVESGAAGDAMDSAAYEKYCEERSH